MTKYVQPKHRPKERQEPLTGGAIDGWSQYLVKITLSASEENDSTFHLSKNGLWDWGLDRYSIDRDLSYYLLVQIK